jgi:hypothetical protein
MRILSDLQIHLIPDTPGPTSLIITLPLDKITAPSTRAHLARLPRLTTLNLTFSHFSLEMAQLLASLPHLKELKMRMVSLLPGPELLDPFSWGGGAHTLEGGPVQALRKLELHVLTKIPEADLDRLRESLRWSERLKAVATVYHGIGEEKEVVYAPTVEAVLELARQEEEEERRRLGLGPESAQGAGQVGERQVQTSAQPAKEGEGEGKPWQRTTNVRLFGGLMNLRMEAKKK